MKYIGQMKYYSGQVAGMALMLSVFIIVMISCGSKMSEAGYGGGVATPDEAEFHADNDIAMTVCSIVDAVRVGERLDSADYDFDGVLTDGQGTPLYTDFGGNPGKWIVRVVCDSVARISNVHLGDLMTEDLRNYILGALNLNAADLVTAYANPDNELELIWLYDIGDVNVSFSTIDETTPSGMEGQKMTVSVFRK